MKSTEKKPQSTDKSSAKSPFFVRYLDSVHPTMKTGLKAGATYAAHAA